MSCHPAMPSKVLLIAGSNPSIALDLSIVLDTSVEHLTLGRPSVTADNGLAQYSLPSSCTEARKGDTMLHVTKPESDWIQVSTSLDTWSTGRHNVRHCLPRSRSQPLKLSAVFNRLPRTRLTPNVGRSFPHTGQTGKAEGAWDPPVIASRRDGMPTPVDYFRHRSPTHLPPRPSADPALCV
jgi:hypothetical protein